MELKNKEAMIMTKITTPVATLTILALLNMSSSNKMFMTKMNLLKSEEMNLTIMSSEYTMLFSLMVLMVSTVISNYSSFYMEFYNKKKYSMLMTAFLISMLILSWSSDLNTSMLGWDGLGISSIFLIMMYQSKNTMANSILTMSFNRMGDILLMMGILMSTKSLNSQEFFINYNMPPESIIILLMASMTKSAQFPLSTWLPAAMSAPTPISAMVHSSTLVTAGIYLTVKMSEIISSKNLLWLITITSSLSMITAGLCSLYEPDLKKIIAFSTMGNISLMMFMMSMKMEAMAMIHMFNHAMFKTSIFKSAGKMFLSLWSNQQLMMINIPTKSNQMNKNSMKISTLALTGMPYTSSFYSKDTFMEMLSMKSSYFQMMIMSNYTLLTLMYCKKILLSTKEKSTKTKSMYLKKNNTWTTSLISIISISSSKLASSLMSWTSHPVIPKAEMSMIYLILILSCMTSIKKHKMMMNLSSTMMSKKIFTSTKTNKIFKATKNIYLTDLLMSSSMMWKVKSMKVELPSTSDLTISITMITWLIFTWLILK